MHNAQKYSRELKLQVVAKYTPGVCGYKKLAREYKLPRDTVRDWCHDPNLQSEAESFCAFDTDIDSDATYDKTAAFLWYGELTTDD